MVREGNRVRLEQVSSGELADAADGLQELVPQIGQVAVERKRRSRSGLFADHRRNGRRRCPGSSNNRGLGADRLETRKRGRGRFRLRQGNDLVAGAFAQGLQMLEDRIEADRIPRFDRLEERDLQRDLFRNRIAQTPLAFT